jgi:hypothetical protein
MIKKQIGVTLVLVGIFLTNYVNGIFVRVTNFASNTSINVVLEGHDIVVKDGEVTGYFEISEPMNSTLTFRVENSSTSTDFIDSPYDHFLLLVYYNSIYSAQIYPDLTFKQANFDIKSPFDRNILWRVIVVPPGAISYSIQVSSSDCYGCGYQLTNQNLSTNYTWDNSLGTKEFRLTYTKDAITINKVIGRGIDMDSLGIYTFVYLFNSQKLITLQDVEPQPYYSPILLLFIFMTLIWIGRSMFKLANKKKGRKSFRLSRSIRMIRYNEDVKYVRLPHIDTFRGLALLVLIFCLNGGANYNFFTESLWIGITYADLPEFGIAWIMGFCIPYAYQNFQNYTDKKWSNIVSHFGRGAVVIILGKLS